MVLVAAISRGGWTEIAVMDEIATSFDRMIRSCDDTVEEVQGFATVIDESAAETMSSVEAIRSASEEVGDSTQQISAGTSDHESIQNLAGEISNLSATVEEVTASAEEQTAALTQVTDTTEERSERAD